MAYIGNRTGAKRILVECPYSKKARERPKRNTYIALKRIFKE
jgi:hypothetical protein